MSFAAFNALQVIALFGAYALYRHIAASVFIRDLTNIFIEQCPTIAIEEAPGLARRMARNCEHEEDRQYVASVIAGDRLEMAVVAEAYEIKRTTGYFPEWYGGD